MHVINVSQWIYQNITNTLVFKIVFQIHYNFFVVLPIQLKICRSVFSFLQEKKCAVAKSSAPWNFWVSDRYLFSSEVASLWNLFLVKFWVSRYSKEYIEQKEKARKPIKHLTCETVSFFIVKKLLLWPLNFFCEQN